MSYWNNNNLNQCLSGEAFPSGKDTPIIIDDFLDDPELTRSRVLDLKFEAPPNPQYGVISFNSPIPKTILAELSVKIKQVLDQDIVFHPRSKCAATFAHIPLNSVCHVDGGDNMMMFNWSVVVYLNLPEQCQGGTQFFRHKETGHSYNQNGWAWYDEDSRDASKWEMVREVEMTFNRAVFIPAWYFHSIAYTFGNTIETARLTLNPKVAIC